MTLYSPAIKENGEGLDFLHNFLNRCHSREGGNPACRVEAAKQRSPTPSPVSSTGQRSWIPAFAGMTKEVGYARALLLRSSR